MMENLSQNIIETAYLKFIHFGIRSISISDICCELRISKKTFYHIFPTKEDLVEATLAYELSKVKEGVEKLKQNKNAIEALLVIIKEVKRLSNYDFTAFNYDLEKYYPAIFAKYQEKKQQLAKQNFESNLQQGIEEGFYRENIDIEMGTILHSFLLINMKKIMEMYPKVSQKRLTSFYIDVLVRLITTEKGLKYVEEHIQ